MKEYVHHLFYKGQTPTQSPSFRGCLDIFQPLVLDALGTGLWTKNILHSHRASVLDSTHGFFAEPAHGHTLRQTLIWPTLPNRRTLLIQLKAASVFDVKPFVLRKLVFAWCFSCWWGCGQGFPWPKDAKHRHSEGAWFGFELRCVLWKSYPVPRCKSPKTNPKQLSPWMAMEECAPRVFSKSDAYSSSKRFALCLDIVQPSH